MLTGNHDRAQALTTEITIPPVAAELRRKIANRKPTGS
jgi:hypothetical protein